MKSTKSEKKKKMEPKKENLMNLNYVPYNPSYGPIGSSHYKRILNVYFRKQPMFIIK